MTGARRIFYLLIFVDIWLRSLLPISRDMMPNSELFQYTIFYQCRLAYSMLGRIRMFFQVNDLLNSFSAQVSWERFSHPPPPTLPTRFQ